MAEFGIVLPNTGFEGEQRFKDIVTLARKAEALGFDHLWTFDRLFHRTVPVLEPFTVLSHVAAVTTKAKLGTSVAILTYRNPFVLAKVVATLDVLSNGRMMLGLSLGRNENEFAAGGVDPSKRVRAFMDAVKLMKSLWAGEPVSYNGPFWRASEAVELPRPVQKPHPPILFGGAAEGVLRRAGRHADGWIAGGMLTPEEVKEKYRVVVESASESGRKDKPLLGKIIYISLNENEDEAARYVADCFKRYYGTEFDVRKFAAIGNAERCAQFLKRCIEAGVELLILSPIPATPEHVEDVWSKVIERLR
ncbi:MAG: LLM class flavin-dependent oxidoreductase [Nitrososphaerota archaeon]|nr:LLM class flavin-dependent oxidoreductase [Candidatus Calditenuis fumarioli]